MSNTIIVFLAMAVCMEAFGANTPTEAGWRWLVIVIIAFVIDLFRVANSHD